jgi:ATP-dependent helicase IRC3
LLHDPVSLRPYQREAIAAVLAARREGVRRLMVSLPTGAGKTVIFAELTRLARRQVLVLAHREELLGQAREKLERVLPPGTVVGVERGADRAPANAKVLVGSIRSLHEARLAELVSGRDIGLIIYDECHHAAAPDNLRVLRQLGVFEPNWNGTLLGFTATTARGDGQGLNAAFERIVYSRSLPELIDDGFLCRLRGFRVATHADLRRLSALAPDFSEEELAEAVDIEERNALVARSIQELARDRRTIAFCVTVRHARNLSHALNAVGVPAGIVHGGLTSDVRARALRDFREGRTQVLTNVGVLTEGFDDPGVSCIAMARPTRSAGLYTQCVGRGTRLAPGKTDCLILDFVDLSTLSLCSLPSLFGMPNELDLQGGDAAEARRRWLQIEIDNPGLELLPGAVTLADIQERAASFDPLTLEVREDVRAISGNGWFSLARHGVGLHYERRAGHVGEFLVLKRGSRGKIWEVTLDGGVMERFSRLEEAVEAVDFEIEQMGRAQAQSALPNASWRGAPVPAGVRERLPERPTAETLADALRLLVWRRVVGG